MTGINLKTAPATAMRCSMTGSANYISTASEQPTPSTKTGAEQISASLPGTALCYSILIRSAKINDQVIIGPHRVAKKILNQPPTPHSELENKEVLEVSPENEWTSGPIFHGERIRPGKNAGRYRKLNLRSLTGLKEYKFKDKENVLLSHIHSLEKWEGENPEEQIKEWLGYKSKSLAEALNNLSSRKTVLWKTYNAANPVQTARHADCTLILNGITECLPEFFQDKDRTQRTRLIKDTLARLG